MSQATTEPRLLVVEDDPISRSFLQDALSALPAEVDAAADIAGALGLVARTEYALWLVDAHLPDGDGLDCLRALREHARTPALAVTAGVGREELDALCAGGFLEVMLKPVSVAALQGTVQRLLRRVASHVREPLPLPPGKLPVWDEGRALAALGGDREALDKLRRMFQAELPTLLDQATQARSLRDAAALRAVLHKLKAGCGFVGAARLLQAVHALSEAPLDDEAWRHFAHAAGDALAPGSDQP